MAVGLSKSLNMSVWMRDEPASESAYKAFKDSKQFASLDGLRCLSILLVIWHHSAGDQYPSDSLLFVGHHGVTLFFVISGFLITTLLLREKGRYQTIYLRQFYMRRALRIFPLYFAVLLIYCGLVFVLERGTQAGTEFFENLIYFASFTSNIFVSVGGDRVIFYFAWSLAAEEQFYLVWPWVEKFMSGGLALMVALGVILASLVSHFLEPWPQHGLLLKVLQSIAIPICLGAVLAHVMNCRRSFVWLYEWLMRLRQAVLPALVLCVFAFTLDGLWSILASVLVCFFVFHLVIFDRSLFHSVLNHRALVAVGRVSFGMYLFHMLCIGLLVRVLGVFSIPNDAFYFPILLFFSASILAYGIARLSFDYFESFFLRQKLKLKPA